MSGTYHTWLNELRFEPCLREGEWTYMPISLHIQRSII